ncbi:MAG: signal peptidase I [candidate division WOR-3 bacterium]
MKNKKTLYEQVKEWVFIIFVVLLIRAFLIQAYVIPSSSMENTLLIGDFLFVFKPVYGFVIPFTDVKIPENVKPKRGEIVVFKFFNESKDYVKRVIALEGDTVEIINKRVYVNGRPMFEPYAVHKDTTVYEPEESFDDEEFQKYWEKGYFSNVIWVRDNFGPVVVPKGTVFVMGDNRDYSWDSRFWGPLPLKYLRGKPLIIYFSFDWNYKRIRFNRLFNIVWNW